jgi:hypothetical protein
MRTNHGPSHLTYAQQNHGVRLREIIIITSTLDSRFLSGDALLPSVFRPKPIPPVPTTTRRLCSTYPRRTNPHGAHHNNRPACPVCPFSGHSFRRTPSPKSIPVLFPNPATAGRWRGGGHAASASSASTGTSNPYSYSSDHQRQSTATASNATQRPPTRRA